jgi:hypothetical protein
MTRIRSNRTVDVLLAAAAAPPYAQDERHLVPVLAAYRAAAHDVARGGIEEGDARIRRRRAARGRLAVKCAVVLALAAGGGVAMASSGMLPAPVQRLAHRMFGAPAPPGGPGAAASGGATAAATTTGTPSPTVAAVSPSGVASPPASLAGLCETVVRSGDGWRLRIDADAQAALLAAAGGEQKVASYCAGLVSGATPSALLSPGGAGSAATSPSAAATHGTARATPTHTPPPVPRPTGH